METYILLLISMNYSYIVYFQSVRDKIPSLGRMYTQYIVLCNFFFLQMLTLNPLTNILKFLKNFYFTIGNWIQTFVIESFWSNKINIRKFQLVRLFWLPLTVACRKPQRMEVWHFLSGNNAYIKEWMLAKCMANMTLVWKNNEKFLSMSHQHT